VIRERGLDVNALDKQNISALHFAMRDGELRAMQELLALGADVHIRYYANSTCLHLAAAGDVEVNALNKCGNTALHVAADKQRLSATKQLLALPGVDVDARTP